MKHYLLAGLMVCFYCFGYSQTLSIDTTFVRQYYTFSDSLQQAEQYDSTILYFQKTTQIYQQHHLTVEYLCSCNKVTQTLYEFSI